jgi:hypothetical protein
MKPDSNLMFGFLSSPCSTEATVTNTGKKQKHSDHKNEIQLTAHAGQNIFSIQQVLFSNSVRRTNFALQPTEILALSCGKLY